MLLDPPIVLHGELSLADVLTANKLLQPSKQRVAVLTNSVLAAVGLFLVGFAAGPMEMDWTLGVFGAGLTTYGLLLFYPKLRDRYQLRQQWKSKTGIFHAVDSTITKDGVAVREPHAEINVAWDHFIAALTGPTVVLLFPKQGWILFGRSRFADEFDWNRFKAFVDDRYPIKPRLV